MTELKFYAMSEAIAMLPYVRSYARSIKLLFIREHKRIALLEALENLITLNVKKRQQILRIIDKLQYRSEYGIVCAKRWKIELEKLGMFICFPNLGIIDIPVWDEVTQKVMLLCVNQDTRPADLFWHKTNENYEHARTCWANPHKYGKRALKYDGSL